jgi:hypothetical protein
MLCVFIFMEKKMSKVLKYRDSGEEVKLLQRALNEKVGLNMKADGVFGKLTEEGLRSFQQRQGIKQTGEYDEATQQLLAGFIDNKYLRVSTIVEKAKANSIPPSMLLAFREVESREAGFLPDGRAIILFERHKFYAWLVRNKGQQFADSIAKTQSNICSPERGGYYGYEREHDRLRIAEGISVDGAWSSASWGMFQVMGFNYSLCGYFNLRDFITDMKLSESKHLDAAIGFLKNVNGLMAAMRQRNYTRVAELYNGKDQQGYDVKMREADKKYIEQGYR